MAHLDAKPQLERAANRPAQVATGDAETSIAPADASVQDIDTELFLLGAAELETGNAVGAAVLLERAIKINGGVAVYHAQLGRAFALLHHFDDATGAFGRAVELDPHCAEHNFQWGLALSRIDDAAKAKVALERAVALNPRHAAAYYHLGRCLYKTGDLSFAVANFERSLRFDPGNAGAHNELGGVFMQMGATTAAVACFRCAIELAPGLAAAHFNLGRVLGERGELIAAVDEFRKVVALEPAAGNWAELGRALAAYGADNECVEICHLLARDRARLKRIGAKIYGDLLQLTLSDEPAFFRRLKELLRQAWIDRCRAV